ncbi:tRNA glutamyl-Q(34) synthetase GluQRS [Candidatus Poribacteria bacterium]|nr:tRNA glutamyl-Q(34) synthetase GluQRS [Candidatus Poribacteria bacterium]
MAGRYAPSPTGALHLGNLRTALAAYCHARSRGGRFLLRIEDLDGPRVVAGAEKRQLEDLHALGITWDEEPLRQSDRARIYEEQLDRLRESGMAYPCFCSRKDIRLAQSAPHREDGLLTYRGTCAQLDPEVARKRVESGGAHCWRLRVAQAPVLFDDRFAGARELDLAREGGDFVICRADGMHAYQLACAVDDALSGVTEVVRGEDLLDSGARQSWLLRCLGLSVPDYLHIPLMLASDGTRLSKRAGADDLSHFAAGGSPPETVRAYLAWTLGQCGLGEVPSMKELSARFDIGGVPREAVCFREEDLRAFRL